MKFPNQKAIAVAIFFSAATLFIVYLLSVRALVDLPVTFFWIAVTLLFGVITFQISRIELTSSYARIVLTEIVLVAVLFHLTYQIPYWGLRGSDVYGDLACVKNIISSGHVMGDPQSLVGYAAGYALFPMIHVFGAMFSSITGIDLFNVVKYFSLLTDVTLFPLLYLLIKSIGRVPFFPKVEIEKIALFSTLMFASLQSQILYSSLFIRQTYGMVLAVCCLYLWFSASHSPRPRTFRALSLIFFISTVVAHHLTSFILLTFLIAHFLVTKVSKVPSLRRTLLRDSVRGEKLHAGYILLASFALLAYWTFVATYPLNTLISIGEDIVGVNRYGTRSYDSETGMSSTPIQTIRGYILAYGFYFFVFVFGLMLLGGLLRRNKNRRLEMYSFTMLFFLCGSMGFLFLYVISAAAFPDRFLLFGWFFGFAPLVTAITKYERRWLKIFGVFLLVSFLLYNVYSVDPLSYDPQVGGVPLVTSTEDYALAYALNFSGSKIYGPQNPLMTIYDVQNTLGHTSGNLSLKMFDFIIINRDLVEEMEKYPPGRRPRELPMLEQILAGDLLDYDRTYESGNLVVFTKRQ